MKWLKRWLRNSKFKVWLNYWLSSPACNMLSKCIVEFRKLTSNISIFQPGNSRASEVSFSSDFCGRRKTSKAFALLKIMDIDRNWGFWSQCRWSWVIHKYATNSTIDGRSIGKKLEYNNKIVIRHFDFKSPICFIIHFVARNFRASQIYIIYGVSTPIIC